MRPFTRQSVVPASSSSESRPLVWMIALHWVVSSREAVAPNLGVNVEQGVGVCLGAQMSLFHTLYWL